MQKKMRISEVFFRSCEEWGGSNLFLDYRHCEKVEKSMDKRRPIFYFVLYQDKMKVGVYE